MYWDQVPVRMELVRRLDNGEFMGLLAEYCSEGRKFTAAELAKAAEYQRSWRWFFWKIRCYFADQDP